MSQGSADPTLSRQIASIVVFAILISCGSWMGLVLNMRESPGTTRTITSSATNHSIEASPKVTGYVADNGRQIAFVDSRPKFLPRQKLTGLLPVSKDSIDRLEETLDPLLSPTTALGELVLVSPATLSISVTKTLQRVLEKHVGRDHPEISVKVWDFAGDDGAITPSVFRVLDSRVAVSLWALVMDHDGLKDLDKETRSILLGDVVNWNLPYGPRGTPLNASDLHPTNSRNWIQISRYHPVLASYLEPPFVLPLDLLSNSITLPSTWKALSDQIALCNSRNASGLLVGRQLRGSTLPVLAAPPLPTASIKSSSFEHVTPIARRPIRFDVLLSDAKDVQNFSPLLCGLFSRGHHIRVLVVDTSLKFSFNPIKRRTRLFTALEGCPSLEFFTINQYMRRKEILRSIGDDSNYNMLSDVVITLKTHSFTSSLVETFHFGGNVLIQLPKEDLSICDWMAALSLQEWKNWDTPRLEISVITRDRPDSFARLLRSLSAARYFGDTIHLRLNIEQDCDFETLQLAQNYSWPQGSLFLHHRIVHGGLLPAVVESWFPRNNHTYGLLLEDDVELSPLFYAWVKMSILRYRYDSPIDRSPKLFGISLYQQKNVELRPEGRIPFNARTLFANHSLPFPYTPYLSQVPCSWGAVYFPEHWTEFHEYLLLRFSETWLSLEEIIVPNVRSNNWLRSWKKFFIELAYLRGYVMLYPNFENYLSLSTNHLEYGAHVRTRTKEKRDLFDQPLFPLPDEGEGMPAGPTHLLDLPGRTLPRYRDLPVLNLTAGVATEEGLVQIGEQRRTELCAVQENEASSPSGIGASSRNRDDTRNFICANATTNGVSILQ